MTTKQNANWRDQLAFLDEPTQCWFNTITDKELTIRLLLAILWQANRTDCPDSREDWQKGKDYADQSNLYGDIYNALKRLGVADPSDEASDAHDFSGGEG